MANQRFETFLADLPKFPSLSQEQKRNVMDLHALSKNFLKKAKTEPEDCPSGGGRIIVLESGHQPNFLPYSGTWKKAFCLNQIQNRLTESGHPSIAFFGLADQNISTARVLTKNQIPDLNKNGIMKIGFKISDENKLRSFNRIEKPPREDWEREIGKIREHYQKISAKTKFGNEKIKKQWDTILEILWECYETADNFAELDALVFARICTELLDIRLSFFLYSDMHRANLFIEESGTVLRNLSRFNTVYNQEILQNNLEIPRIPADHMPFWYECDCGVKLNLVLNHANESEIKCPVCLREYRLQFGSDFEHLKKYYGKMDFNAVSRNIIMAHGLGVSLFLSGTGGSLVYGRISDRISGDLGLHRPRTLAWQSKDRYLGMMHKIVIWELMKTFSLSTSDFLDGSVMVKTRQQFDEIQRRVDESRATNNQKELKYWHGWQNSAGNLLLYTQKIFFQTPSFIDLLATFPQDTVISLWEKAISNPELQNDGTVFRICADINYPVTVSPEINAADLPALYHAIEQTGV